MSRRGASLEDTSLAFYRAWHIAVGAKHGLLLALRDAALAPETLAARLHLDEAAVADWCRGAWALGLLDRRGGRYRLAPEHAETLGEPASARYMGHHFEYLAAKSLHFEALDARVRGEPTKDVDLRDVYAIATQWDHLAFFELVLPKEPALARALDRGIDVLDLGAGHGRWARELLRRYPRSRVVASDLDLAPLDGLDARHVRDLPARAFDLVFLGEVLASAKEPEEVLRTAHRALRPGGRVVALEGLAPEGTPRSWGERLVLAMQLDFGLDGSRYLTLRQARAAFRAAGFPRVGARDLGGSLFALQARKPQT
ncbi:MAG TPA: class I SAM-dependent methyltransferase [Candidatus Thermoplasmatota archaeon]|nr:class I SAM-dependent methyltransferase [Candidatus Thermoplasmatota archaeon]